MTPFDEIQFNLLIQNSTKPVAGQPAPQENAVVTVPMNGDFKSSAAVNQPVVNSVVANEQPQAAAKLDKNGNIPLVSTQSSNENKGLEVEFKKTGESVGERLTRYYKKYENASREEKEELLEKYITGHYATLKDKPRSEQIKIQIADFKKLLSNTKDGDDYEMLASRINILEKENQVLAAKSATTEQTSTELKARGEIGVARAAHKCDADNQPELTQIVANSKNEKAIKIGASHAWETADKNQALIVSMYQGLDMPEEFQKDIDKTLIDQYGKYAKEAEVRIHKIMSNSQFSETVEYAASNIWKFDKENQAPAVQITAETGNEKAINAAAAQWSKYDESAQGEISSIISSTPYESAHKTLTEAQQSANNQASSQSVISTIVVAAQPSFVSSSNTQIRKTKTNNETLINTIARKAKSFALSFGLKTEKTENAQEVKNSLQQEKSSTIQEKIQKVIDGKADISKLSSKEISEMVKNLSQLPSAQREKLVLMLVKSNPKLVLSILPSLDKGIHSKVMAELDTYAFLKYKHNINYSVLSQDSKKRYEEMENKA